MVFFGHGFERKQYSYYDADTKSMDFNTMIADLQTAQSGDVVLLHGCCHNPTGIDPISNGKHWQTYVEKSLLPLFDFAYQGFAKGVEEDAAGLRIFTDIHNELLIASSFSKNFGLYNERVGAFTLVGKTAEEANRAFSQVKSIARVIYSNPPAHGAAIVTEILNDKKLKDEWITEVQEMRDRIQEMRTLFVQTLKDAGVSVDFSFIEQQNGMFSFSGLTPAQVKRLRKNLAFTLLALGELAWQE